VINKGRSTVSRKRYVAGLSNQVVVALKAFTGWAPLLAPAIIVDRVLRDVARRRFENVRLDLEAALLTARRMPRVLEYRRANRAINNDRPGQDYFRDHRFDVARPPDPGAD
jgi:hypothetical protein